jgi:hypothetical protein
LYLAAIAIIPVLSGSLQAGEDLYQKVARSTALIYRNEGGFSLSSGSGFLVDAPGRLVVTARHVVENLNGGIPPFVYVIFAQTEDGEVITDAGYYRKNWRNLGLRGKIVYDSVRRDMAVIQLDKLPPGIKPLELAPRRARPGQTVHVIGNCSEHLGGVFSYCKGYVRNAYLWDELGARVVATQVPTNKGDSGGPTVNDRGEVVGFACWSTTGGPMPKSSSFFDLQVTGLSVCVTEIREGLQEMRKNLLAATGKTSSDGIFTGQTRAGVHFVGMEKDALYRILVKPRGFTPDVRIDNKLVYAGTGQTALPGGDWQHLFTPRETKTYRIQVGFLPGSDLGKGPLAYNLAVDRVQFQPAATIKEPLFKLNEQTRTLDVGKVYRITVKSQDFEPDLQILDGTRLVMSKLNNGLRAPASGERDFFEALGLARPEFETALVFVPARTAAYRILVDASPFSQPGTANLRYTLRIDEAKVVLAANDQLTPKDPLNSQGGHCKNHPVKLEAGKSYQIDLTTTAFDSRLFLEDAAGKVLMSGFDAEGLNGRMFFQPARTGTYRIVVTTSQGAGTGPYLLTVAESGNSGPQIPGPVPKPFKKAK